MTAVLPMSFFDQPADRVARAMLGVTLVRSRRGTLTASRIVETEAYVGEHDLASHSSKGRTPRTEVMFGPAGRFYVYRIYGLHWMLNVVTGAVGEGTAVLIRGTDDVRGPARLTAALAIDGSFDGKAAVPATGLWFEKAAADAGKVRIERTPRIGVDYAGPLWAGKKLRFVLKPPP